MNPWEFWPAERRPATRITPAWAREIARDPHLRRVVQAVEVLFGDGGRYRVGTEAVDSARGDGSDRWVSPGLMAEAEIENTYDLDSAAAVARSGSFEVPAYIVDAHERKVAGLPFAGFGEVSLVAPGMRWEDRRVLLLGDMSGGVTVGGTRSRRGTDFGEHTDGQTVGFQLEDPRASGDAMFPPHVVDLDRWPDAFENAIGQAYPVVYGNGITQALQVTSGSAPTFLAVYGHGWDVNRIWRNDELVSASFTTSETYDELGAPVTVVIPNGGAFTWADGDRVLVEVLGEVESVDLLDIVRDVVERHSPGGVRTVNRQLFADAKGALGPMPVRAQANTSATVFRWVEEDQLEDFPMVAMVWEDGQYGPVVTDYRGIPRTQLEVGTARLPFRLTDPTETPKEQCFNSFTLRYGYDTQLDQFTKVLQVDWTNNPTCKASESMLGPRIHPVVESISIEDDVTAATVVDWMVAHLTFPTWYVDYSGRPDLFWELRRGDTIELTDPDHAWARARATVERLAFRRSFLTLGLRVWASPFRPVQDR